MTGNFQFGGPSGEYRTPQNRSPKTILFGQRNASVDSPLKRGDFSKAMSSSQMQNQKGGKSKQGLKIKTPHKQKTAAREKKLEKILENNSKGYFMGN